MKLYIKKVKNSKGEVKEWIWIKSYNNSGKLVRKSLKLINSKENWKKAELIRANILLQKEKGEFIEKQIPTLDEYMKISFEMNKGTRTASTQYGYQVAYDKRISPILGHRKIDTIKPADVKLLQSGLVGVVSPRRIKNIRAVLNGILSDALDNDLITKNPVSATKTIPLDDSEIYPFSMNEIALILENSEGQYQNFYALAFMTGMRSGEIIALKWSDIDFFKSEINISRTKRMGVEKCPKTKSSKRTIDILDSLKPYLQKQYELTGHKNSYVFLNQDEEGYHDIRRIRDSDWRKTIEKSGLEYRTIYQTRHSFATMMLSNGEDILWVSHTLGHKNSSITLEVYARYIKSKEKKRGSFLEEGLSSKIESPTMGRFVA
ncbi:tyrosine-type recombinase/integrase [Sulfurimonas sp.]